MGKNRHRWTERATSSQPHCSREPDKPRQHRGHHPTTQTSPSSGTTTQLGQPRTTPGTQHFKLHTSAGLIKPIAEPKSSHDEGPRCWLAHCPHAPSSHTPCSHRRSSCIACFCIAEVYALCVFAFQMCFAGICIPDVGVLHSHCGRVCIRGADACIGFTLRALELASACIVFANACTYSICIAGACMCIAGVLRCALLVSAVQMFTLLAHLRSLHMWLTRALLVHAFLAHTVMIRTLLALLACALLAHTLHHTSHTHCIIVRTQIASLYHTHCAHLYLQELVSRCI